MFNLVFFTFYFVQYVTAFHGSGGLVGFVFGFQKLCFCRCGIAQRNIARNGRLLGGETATPHQFPWMATVYSGSTSFGGSLISDRHVLTAASPLYGVSASHITVSLGGHDRCGLSAEPALNSSVATVSLHPGFSSSDLNHDIALLRLTHMVPFSQYIAPVCMPLYGMPEPGQVAWTAGWIKDSNSSLTCTPRIATLPILPTRTCLKVAAGSQHNNMSPDKGCLGPVGAKSIICKSDVGAPVMTRWVAGGSFRLVGVMASSSSCDEEVAPQYTRVIDHAAWIFSHLREDCMCF